jgi:hypothetical protein
LRIDLSAVRVLAGLRHALTLAHELNPGVQPRSVLDTWTEAITRSDVAEDYRTSRTLPIQDSLQIFWPDGSTTHNPRMTDHDWSGGLVRIGRTDPNEARRLLLAQVH